MKDKLVFTLLMVGLFCCSSSAIAADNTIELIKSVPTGGGVSYSTNLQILAGMTVISLLPAILLTMTAFPRILIVLALLRQALGTSSNPTNKILIGIALLLTLFVMYPVFTDIKQHAIDPYSENKITDTELVIRVEKPIRKFMMDQTRKKDIDLFLSMTDTKVDNKSEVPLPTLMIAYLTSELQTAFQIGFIIFIPFLVIDLIVASTLMGLGMMMVSPMIISVPVKLMLFVLIDGWSLVLSTLAKSFYF
ncbi:flagellar biosynthetic protein FliP [Photobacterium kishitanii]|uniref:flagellar type III secretion system pore protein FliP n=1 Tax=Photobacterium kishitanii TaxID=318456 RepID=UPI000D1689AE|nr:flagellar type III secretion system pore protein FliP [Photobacterium kishitanii]PSW59446.1 flagellar biosynthetic protein FliP [Photobacterium kishitanii]